jgi:hypothetical protein
LEERGSRMNLGVLVGKSFSMILYGLLVSWLHISISLEGRAGRAVRCDGVKLTVLLLFDDLGDQLENLVEVGHWLLISLLEMRML